VLAAQLQDRTGFGPGVMGEALGEIRA